MDRKPRKGLSELSCAVCSLQFCFKEPSNPVGPRCPLLLQCGHSVCEGCLRSVTRGTSAVECTICFDQSAITNRNHDELREEFPLNIYTVGQIVLKKGNKLKLDDVGIGFYSQKKKATSQVNCVECGSVAADCSCRQCCTNLCSPCFVKIHSSANTLKAHQKINFVQSEEIVAAEVICHEHRNKTYNMYCNYCDIYCCPDCDIKKHLKHSLVDVAEMNTDILPELIAAHGESSSVLKQLQFSKKKLQSAGTADKGMEQVEQQVAVHFSALHGLLQLQELAMCKRLKTAQRQTAQSVAQLSAQLGATIKEMEIALKASSALLENATQIPLSPLLKKLKRLSSTPSYLVLGTTDESKLEFNVEPTIYKLIKEHCTLTLPENRSYELRSKSDLPEDYVFEDIEASLSDLTLSESKQQPIKHIPRNESPTINLPSAEAKVKKSNYTDVLKKNKATLAKNNAELAKNTSDSISAEKILLDAICGGQPIQEVTVEIVRIVHLLTPNDFYVQRKSTQHLIEKLRENFSRYIMCKSEPRFIELGKMYLVQFHGDEKWYRAVAQNVVGDKYDVFYVDYGNKDTVALSRIREIPEKYFNIPEQAIHCSLYGCMPVEGTWTEQSIHLLTSMTQEVDLSMYVVRIHRVSKMYEVQLTTTDETKCSITDALTFLSCAVKTESVKSEEGLFNPRCEMPNYQPNVVDKNETFMAQVTHVNTPSNFFIQRMSDAGLIFTNLMDDMNKVYRGLKYNHLAVYNPKVGMPVAAKFSDGRWHRAKVVNIPQNRSVQVQYVDFGNIDILDWTSIRILMPKYLRVSVQALKCSLSHIASTHSKGWQSSAKKAFEAIAPKDALLQAFVEDVSDNGLSVILYHNLYDKYICVNGIIVQQGHAISVGPSSAHPVYLGEYNSGANSEPDTDVASIKSSSIVTNKKRYTSPPSSVASNLTAAEELSTARECVEDSRFKVKILKVVTLDEIHLAFEKTYKDIVRLHKHMNNHYNYELEEAKDWNVGDFCAVMKVEDNKRNWYRGVIQEVVNDEYKVYVKDTVDQLIVDSSSLRKLIPQFQAVPDGSFQCHMVGVRPPGGMTKWPLSTNDYVKLILKRYPDLYITTVENQEETIEGSVPVQIWAKHKKYDPLAPTIEEWMNIASQLYNLGFVNFDPKCKALVQDGFDFETQKDFVKQWLDQTFQEAAEDAESLEFEEEIQPSYNYRAKRYDHNPRLARFVPQFEEPSNALPEFKTVKPAPSQKLEKAVAKLETPRERPKVGLETIPAQLYFDFNVTKKEWPPATPFSKLDFIAWPTYVDYDCAIYIQDIEKSRDKLDHIQKALSSLYEDTIPRPHDLLWNEGELCIAFYNVDKKWYRGKVMQVIDEKVEVLFVDYGNTEKLLRSELRKEIALDHIPIQCHRCSTQGLIPVSPNATWPTKTLDFVHYMVVDKPSQVQLKIGENGEYVIMKLNMSCEEELLHCLVQMHYATYVIDCDKIAESSDVNKDEIVVNDSPRTLESPVLSNNTNLSTKPDELKQALPANAKVMDWFDLMIPDTGSGNELQKKLSFKTFVLPEGLLERGVAFVDVIAVSSANKVYISLSCDNVDDQVQETLQAFTTLHETLQKKAPTMPVIDQISPGTPCVACYTDDHVWYRAIITEVIDSKTAKVLYVDYENEEALCVDRIRGIRSEWMDVPMQSIEFILHNIRKGPNFTDNKVFSELLIQAISISAPPFTMVIEEAEPSLKGELYCATGELLYQSLIDLGFLAKEN